MTKRLSLLISVFAFSLAAHADWLPQALQPQLHLPQAERRAPSAGETVLTLIDYLRQHVVHESIDQLEKDNAGYNRREDFGGWIVADSKASCLDTRGAVLVRSEDSATPIQYKDARNCLVISGLWHEPYAGTDVTQAKQLQIDHVVPLKHVYITGGKDWAPAKRCYYANFLHNPFHLLAVSGHENMAKGDKAPDGYLPPDTSFQCEYVSTWMKVKAIWGLVATDSEVDAIQKVIDTNHCDESKLSYPVADLQTEQDAIDSTVPSRCQDFAKVGAPGFTSSN